MTFAPVTEYMPLFQRQTNCAFAAIAKCLLLVQKARTVRCLLCCCLLQQQKTQFLTLPFCLTWRYFNLNLLSLSSPSILDTRSLSTNLRLFHLLSNVYYSQSVQTNFLLVCFALYLEMFFLLFLVMAQSKILNRFQQSHTKCEKYPIFNINVTLSRHKKIIIFTWILLPVCVWICGFFPVCV